MITIPNLNRHNVLGLTGRTNGYETGLFKKQEKPFEIQILHIKHPLSYDKNKNNPIPHI